MDYFVHIAHAQNPLQEPVYDPNYLNVEYLFNLLLHIPEYLQNILLFLFGTQVGVPVGTGAMMLKYALWFISALLACGIGYSLYRLHQLAKEDRERYRQAQEEALAAVSEEHTSKRWKQVLDYLDSPDESEWKLAIVEADLILADMLERIGFHGDTIGEKLKSIERSDFPLLDFAWEAHRVRNRIAHEGAAFRITKREAQRIIDLYRQVFEEYHFI